MLSPFCIFIVWAFILIPHIRYSSPVGLLDFMLSKIIHL
jgi:hypothetical protein